MTNTPAWWQFLSDVRHMPPARMVLIGAIALVLPLGVSAAAFQHLLTVNGPTDCRESAWVSESASTRLYCAETLAGRQTLGDLREAIELASSIPANSGLTENRDRLVERWSKEILRMGEESFQAGDLEAALAAARSIPMSSRTYGAAVEQVAQWQRTWEKAEIIYTDAQRYIERQDWFGTIETGRKLLALGNRYWATTRYQELMQNMQLARENQNANRTKKAQAKPSPKPNDMLASWQRRQQDTMNSHMDRAYALANRGDTDSLRAAVAEAQMVFFDTPRYEEAQQAIDRWQRRIESLEDRPYLQRAAELASQGNADGLRAAINEASMIAPGRALYGEARDRMAQWEQRIQELRRDRRAPAAPPPIVESPGPTLPPLAPLPTRPLPTGLERPRPVPVNAPAAPSVAPSPAATTP